MPRNRAIVGYARPMTAPACSPPGADARAPSAPSPARAVPAFPAVRLDTPRLRLRPLAPGDAEGLYRMQSDPDFMRYWSSRPWTTLAQAQALIALDQQAMAAHRYLRLAVERREDAALVGTCSLFAFDEAGHRAEIGYGIARAHWRRGYAVESVGALVGFGFDRLGLHRIEAEIDPANRASARSLETLGFRREGLLRERWIIDGRVSDSALYGLLASDRPDMRQAPATACDAPDH